jgi:hypothetical protein
MNAMQEANAVAMATMNAKLDALAGALTTLAAPLDDRDGGASAGTFCDTADGAGLGAPEILANGAAGGSLDLRACGGSIAMHSEQCSFDPCAVQQQLRHVQAKLAALDGN